MKRMSPCTPGLSITELTRSRRLYKWNPRLSVCHMEEKTNKHRHEFVEVSRGGRYMPKNAESLSIKNKTLYGYTIMPSWVHLQMQTGKFLEEGLHFSQRKVCSCQTDWVTQWKHAEKNKVKPLRVDRIQCDFTAQQVGSVYVQKLYFENWKFIFTSLFNERTANFLHTQFMSMHLYELRKNQPIAEMN